MGFPQWTTADILEQLDNRWHSASAVRPSKCYELSSLQGDYHKHIGASNGSLFYPFYNTHNLSLFLFHQPGADDNTHNNTVQIGRLGYEQSVTYNNGVSRPAVRFSKIMIGITTGRSKVQNCTAILSICLTEWLNAWEQSSKLCSKTKLCMLGGTSGIGYHFMLMFNFTYGSVSCALAS